MQKGERLADDSPNSTGCSAAARAAAAQLRRAARRLDRIAAEHPLLAEALAALDRAVIEASEGEEETERARRTRCASIPLLDAAETRLFELRALARKHRCEVDELPDKMRDAVRKALERRSGREAELEALEAAAKGAVATLSRRCQALQRCAQRGGPRLDAASRGNWRH